MISKEESIITVALDVHCYRGDHIADFLFDSSSLYFIGKVEGEKIKKNRNKEFKFLFSDFTTLGDFSKKVLFELFDGEDYCCKVLLRIVGKNDLLFYVSDAKSRFSSILTNEFILNSNDLITVKLFVSYDAGTYDVYNNLRYFMHSNEKGLEPHVHVNVLGTDYSASIPIMHPDNYIGNMPKKYLKKAIEKVVNEKVPFLMFWNAHTNGLSVDINEALGIIEY